MISVPGRYAISEKICNQNVSEISALYDKSAVETTLSRAKIYLTNAAESRQVGVTRNFTLYDLDRK